MTLRITNRILPKLSLAAAALTLAGCENYGIFPESESSGDPEETEVGGIVSSGNGFAEVLIQGRTFVNGNSVRTVTYGVTDKKRVPVGIDFNGDAKIDPVVVYSPGTNGGVFQILLSKGGLGTVDFSYLTLDGNDRWSQLWDVAVGDIDGDGAWDLIGASGEGVVYLHNPGPGRVTVLREWGSINPELEFLAGSTTALTKDELEALLEDLLPAGTSLADYKVTISQGYNRCAIADFDNDNDNDVVATRRLNIRLEPMPGSSAPPIELITGELQLFLNPGGAKDGTNWLLATVGQHERYVELDRQNATAIVPFDMDGDGDLDLVSAARDDINAQIAWFENPGSGSISQTSAWTQWRIGSVRDAFSLDVADFTGDGRLDVVAVGALQQQLVLFRQPVEGPWRDYDWDSSVLVTFESYFPLDVKALDIDRDGQLELVLGGTNGALRYFESPGDPTSTWNGVDVVTFNPPGEVSLLGYGDLDADGDLDLVAAINDLETENDQADRVTWIRNDRP